MTLAFHQGSTSTGEACAKWRLGLLCVSLLCLAGCGAPSIRPMESPGGPTPGVERATACRARFLHRPHRTVHAIHADMPGGGREDMVGVTVVDPENRMVRVVLLSIEGTVLFDGVTTQGAGRVLRAWQSLSNPEFSRGLFRDVEFLNLMPDGNLLQGHGETDTCAWRDRDGRTTEVEDLPGGVRVIRGFSPRGKLVRRARLSLDAGRKAVKAHLVVFQGRRPYSLDLELESFEFIDSTRGLFVP